MKHMVGGVEVQQTRKSEYNGALLASATNPESGKTEYFYNSADQVTQRKAANHQLNYYDGYGRMSALRTPNCRGGFNTDIQYYWELNPFDSSYSGWVTGKLGAVTFGSGAARYEYAYDFAGRPSGKRLRIGNGQGIRETRGYDVEGNRFHWTRN